MWGILTAFIIRSSSINSISLSPEFYVSIHQSKWKYKEQYHDVDSCCFILKALQKMTLRNISMLMYWNLHIAWGKYTVTFEYVLLKEKLIQHWQAGTKANQTDLAPQSFVTTEHLHRLLYEPLCYKNIFHLKDNKRYLLRSQANYTVCWHQLRSRSFCVFLYTPLLNSLSQINHNNKDWSNTRGLARFSDEFAYTSKKLEKTREYWMCAV